MNRRGGQDWRSRLGPLAREALDGAAARAPDGVAAAERMARDGMERLARWRAERRAMAAAAPKKTRLLWLLPLPLLPAAAVTLAKGDLTGFAATAGAYALVTAGAVLARRGLRAEAAMRQQKFQVNPGPPAKLLGWLTVGVGTALAAFAGGQDPLVASVFGLGAAGGCALLYGLDPKPQVSRAAASADARVHEALARAERQIIAIEAARDGLAHPELSTRLGRIASVARLILGHIAEDPGDMRRARRFLVTYLEGAQKVATGYAKRHRRDQAGELEESFRRVLVTIEDVFRQQHQRLLEHDLRDLDVQIEVLETQMRREGLD